MIPATIDVGELRLGMFIHLDGGWLSHPFPLSSFKLTSPTQIETVRSLGVARVRWSPEKSELPKPVVVPTAPAETAEQAERRQRREALEAQRCALALAERQYAEAGKAWRACADRVFADPQGARAQVEGLTQALLDKMLGDGDLCIRLLTEGAGERSATHAMNVTVISLLMGRIFGFTPDELADLGTGALLHDVGKLDLPDRVRHHDDRFTPAEAALYREHVAHGVAQGRRMGLSPGALLVIAQHHEQADGSGFPQKLNIDRMTAAARIVGLVNRYDNLCNPAQSSKAMTPHEALSLMFAHGQHKFDVTMLNAFIRMMGVYPPGSVVQLTDDRYALVTGVNSSRPLKPRVLVHDEKVSRHDALHMDLEVTPGIGIRRSLRPTQLPADAANYLAPRQRVAYFFEDAPKALQAA